MHSILSHKECKYNGSFCFQYCCTDYLFWNINYFKKILCNMPFEMFCCVNLLIHRRVQEQNQIPSWCELEVMSSLVEYQDTWLWNDNQAKPLDSTSESLCPPKLGRSNTHLQDMGGVSYHTVLFHSYSIFKAVLGSQ